MKVTGLSEEITDLDGERYEKVAAVINRQTMEVVKPALNWTYYDAYKAALTQQSQEDKDLDNFDIYFKLNQGKASGEAEITTEQAAGLIKLIKSTFNNALMVAIMCKKLNS